MNRNRTTTLLYVFGLIAAMIVLFVWLQEPVRLHEARIAAEVANLFPGQDSFTSGTRIFIFPEIPQVFIVAVLSPSCSCLAAVLAVLTLSLVTPKNSPSRKALAVTAALLVVIVGNFARLVGSLLAGRMAGQAALVLFHDVAGGIFTFIYILAAYVLMLWILLPKEREREPEWEFHDVAA